MAIGFGIIGAGGWGELHARVYSTMPGADLIGVCDVCADRAAEIASRYGAPLACTDVRELLSEPRISAVSIVTPDFAHTEPALAAASAGKHMLVEKPLATTEEDCQRIIDAAGSAGVILMVDFHNRFSPPFYKARCAVEKGEIGEPQLIYYRLSDTIFVPTKMLSWAADSTVMWFIGSHSIDTVCWMLGEYPTRVYALSRRRVLEKMGIGTPDFYEATFEFPSGAAAVVENSWILPETAPNIIDLKCEIIGGSGALYIDGSHHRVLQRYTSKEATYPDVLVMPQVYDKQMGFAAESIRHFAECVMTGRQPIVTGEDGRKVTKIICAVEESVRTRQPVEIAW